MRFSALGGFLRGSSEFQRLSEQFQRPSITDIKQPTVVFSLDQFKIEEAPPKETEEVKSRERSTSAQERKP